jgi:transcriptional regulator with XRE-family HTH domain
MHRTRIRTLHDLASVARARRIERGLSQAELGARTGVSRSWINSFERGKRTVELALVFKVFEVLEISVEAAPVTKVGPDAGTSPPLATLLEDYYNQ